MDTSQELKDFLKLVFEDLEDVDPTSVAVVATDKTGEVGVHYFKCDVATKILYSGFIQQDAMIATLKENKWIPKIGQKNIHTDPEDML